ncbi:MAG: MFS transporter [Lysobacterales bacterium]
MPSTQPNTPFMPRMAAVLLPRELLSWSLLAVSLGALESGLLGVIVKNQFSNTASPQLVNLAVAVVAGAASFTNVLSFFFAARAMGQGKVLMVSRLMLILAAALCLLALMPVSGRGLVGFTALTVTALACWSGIQIVRSVVWRANYPRLWRGQITARITQLAALLTAVCSASIGIAMSWHGPAWRAMFPVAALCAAVASVVYRRSRVRRQRRLLQAEQSHRSSQGGRIRIRSMAAILRENRDFRRYMIAMMVFGSGNLMVVAMLVVLMNDRLGLDRLTQVLVTSSVPVLVLCLTVRSWARVLDRRHIVSYRVVQSWTFVAANAAFATAMIAGSTVPLWIGSVLLGVAWGGGLLGWNLGHNDFADDADASLFMATHVGLTGLRGLIAPILGVLVIQWLEVHSPGRGVYAMVLPLCLTLVGWTLFLRFHLELQRR